jgi:prepilin-type N-terminal cleavage/methylation domain-containing protein
MPKTGMDLAPPNPGLPNALSQPTNDFPGGFRIFEGVSVKKTQVQAMKAGRQRIPESGFTMFELVIVVFIILIVSAMAIIQLQPTWQQFQANAALDQVKTTVRQARETAISQRRTIVVVIPTAVNATPCPPGGGVVNCIELYQMVVSGTPPVAVQAATPFLVIPIENHAQLLSFAGEPDTPDAFIGAPPTAPAGIYYAANTGAPPSGMQFQSDGTFTDGTGAPINVTILLGEPNIPTTARAVTILGNTGRVTPYHGTGVAWFK